MILPEKHVTLEESFFGFGGYLLNLMDGKISVDNLWKKYSKVNNSREYNAYHTFDDYILALDYLYIIGAINQNEKGEIFNETNKSKSQ